MIVALSLISVAGAIAQPSPLPATVANPTTPALALPDPLPPGDLRTGPGHVHFLALGLLVILPVGLAWGALAAQRAWRDDPWRERRAAHRALLRLLEKFRQRPPTPDELETWRSLSVSVWAMPQAVPTLAEVAAQVGASASPQTWVALWQEAEEAMYSPRPGLSANWVAQANALARQIPPFPALPWWPDQPRHWWPAPLAAGLALMLIVNVSSLHAAEALAAYQSGHFAEAGKDWLAQAAQRPGDWSVRHNAALSLAQQEQWGRAAGTWTSAFLLNPQAPSIVIGLKASLVKIETADPALRRLVEGDRWDHLVARFSVAEWQRLIGTGAFALSLGLVATVFSLYRVKRVQKLGWRLAGFALVLLGGATAFTAVSAVKRYGPLADSQAAFITRPAELRSIPSDLVGKQQTSTLFTGTVVKVHRSFLGWDQVSVGGNVAGWVRSDALVWLYRSRNDSAPATILKP